MWDSCIRWNGGVTNSGYGPHQKMWEEKNGPLPEGHHLHHICYYKRCINIDHLELLTIKEHRQETVDELLGEAEHGTRRMYEGQRCSCDPCRKANADRQREFQRAKGRNPRPIAVCGTRSMYVKGCRCEDCREAALYYERSRSKRR